jgi:hypothetical protein
VALEDVAGEVRSYPLCDLFRFAEALRLGSRDTAASGSFRPSRVSAKPACVPSCALGNATKHLAEARQIDGADEGPVRALVLEGGLEALVLPRQRHLFTETDSEGAAGLGHLP